MKGGWDGGDGDDALIYTVADGQDLVYILGGPGYDTLTVNTTAAQSYTLVEESGQVLCSQGCGGTYMIVRNVEEITVLGAGLMPLPPHQAGFFKKAETYPALFV